MSRPGPLSREDVALAVRPTRHLSRLPSPRSQTLASLAMPAGCGVVAGCPVVVEKRPTSNWVDADVESFNSATTSDAGKAHATNMAVSTWLAGRTGATRYCTPNRPADRRGSQHVVFRVPGRPGADRPDRNRSAGMDRDLVTARSAGFEVLADCVAYDVTHLAVVLIRDSPDGRVGFVVDSQVDPVGMPARPDSEGRPAWRLIRFAGSKPASASATSAARRPH
jgi:hypothetical protein